MLLSITHDEKRLETFHMLCGVGGEKGKYFMCSVPC